MLHKFLRAIAAAALCLMAGNVGRAQPYSNAVMNLNPAAYWPLAETAQPPFGAYVATNLGTAGTAGNGYYETWFQPLTAGGVTTYYQSNSIVHVSGATSDGDTAMSCTRAAASSGQFVVLPRSTNGVINPATTLTPPFSIEFWANPTTTSNTVLPIINQGRVPVLDASTGYLNNNEEGFCIGQFGTIFFFATWNNRGGDSTKQEIDTALTANAWQHMVVTFNGTNQTWFKNGVQVGTRTIPNSAANSVGQLYVPDLVDPLIIGTGSIIGGGNGASQFAGSIDEVAIYTNILDSTSIQNHYNARTATDNSYANAVLANNPAVYLRLDEPSFNTYPSSSSYPVANNYGSAGAAANGAYQPGTSPGAAGPNYSGFGGSSSRAVAINGYSGGVDVGGGALPSLLNPTNNQPVSLTAWFQGNPADAAARFQEILGHGNSSWRIALDNNAGLRFNPGNGPELQFANTADVVTNGFVVDDGKWHFVAGVSDGTTNALYIDGLLAKTGTAVGTITGSTLDAVLGGDPGFTIPSFNGSVTSQPRYFDGQIAHIAFFTNSLTASQIQQIYAAAGVPPSIVQQPVASQTNNAGQTVTISVLVHGSGPLAYQWYKVGSGAVGGATSSSLVFNPVVLANGGSYFAVITNNYGSVTSTVDQLTVFGPPVVQQQSPTDARVFVGTSPALRVTATGPQPISYQWTKDGAAISGATSSSYSPSTASTGTHTYGCTITNLYSTNVPSSFNTITMAVLSDPSAPYPAQILADHPSDYFRLDEASGATAYDYAGGLNGTYTNAVLGQANYTSGFSPQSDPTETSANFGGPGDSYAGKVPTFLSFAATNGSSSAFSIEGWLNAGGTQPNTDAGIVTIGYGFGGEQFAIDCGAHVNGSRTLRFYVNDASGATHSATCTNGTLLTDGNWHHFVAVCDEPNGHVYLYVDGFLNGSATITAGTGIRSLTAPLAIGSRLSTSSATVYDNQFGGDIDDVSVFNYALSSSQALSHFLAAGIAPYIYQQPPATVATNEGSTIRVTLGVIGTSPLSYHWQTNGVNMPGQTNASFVISNVSQAAWDGVYVGVTVTNLYGTAVSLTTLLSVQAGPPIISTDLQPLLATNFAGASFSYSAGADGTAPFTYQWYQNGAPVSGATNSTFTFTTLAGSNTYYVHVSNTHGAVDSSTATLVGVPSPTLNPLAYSYKTKISVAGYNLGETLSDFPILVQFGTNLPGFAYSQMASPSGSDLRFTDSGGTREIPHEIDEWNPGGTSIVWVQVPRLAGTNAPSNTNNFIWAYWGNSSATTLPAYATNGSVWTPQAFEGLPAYEIVYHLKEGALPFADSTTQYPAAGGVAPTATPGAIGQGGSFNGSAWLDSGSVNLGDSFTLSAWVNLSPADIIGYPNAIQPIWANQHGGFGMAGFAMDVNTYQHYDGIIDITSGIGSGTGSEAKTASGAVSYSQWHLLEAELTQSSGSLALYLDGQPISVTAGFLQPGFTNFVDLNLGRFTDGSFSMHGIVDEARIRQGTNSAAWVWADYMTVASNNTFQAYAPVSNSGVVLNAQLINGKLVLTWSPGNLPLLSGSQITGVTNLVSGATSPYTNSVSTSQQYFRIKVQ